MIIGQLVLVGSGYVRDIQSGLLLLLGLVVVLQPVGHLQDALLQASPVTGDLLRKYTLVLRLKIFGVLLNPT